MQGRTIIQFELSSESFHIFRKIAAKSKLAERLAPLLTVYTKSKGGGTGVQARAN